MNNEKEKVIIQKVISTPFESWQFIEEKDKWDRAEAKINGMEVKFFYGTLKNGTSPHLEIDGIEIYDDNLNSLRVLGRAMLEFKSKQKSDERSKLLNDIYKKILNNESVS